MHASTTTREKLAHLVAELRRTYPEVSPDDLQRLVEETAFELLEEARFEDFVPLLVHRRARQALAVRAPAPAPC